MQGKTVGWIPIEQDVPKDDNYVLISFENYGLPAIGRYEEDEDGGGTFYEGDEGRSCLSYGLIPNAWQPVPENYREDLE